MTIRTTHTGSLPRPSDLTALLVEREEGGPGTGLTETAARAVRDAVRRQAAIGIDCVNDGEQGKPGYSTYVRDRLNGFDGETSTRPRSNDLIAHQDFVELSIRLRGRPSAKTPACTGPISLADRQAVHQDIANLKAGARAAGVASDHLFMSAASPGVISMFFQNQYYPTRQDYLAAIVDAMRDEYRAIVDAGLILQLDCPDFAMSHNSVFQDLSVEEFRREVALAVDALNAAVDGLPPERMRVHVCWGNYESPHHTDVALADLIDLIGKVRPAGVSVEGANPRHGHEWTVFEHFALPEDKYLVAGVIDTTTNYVEHPELVAQRLGNYTRMLGKERVVAANDCGFDSFIGRDRVAPSVVWSKLAALVEGAALAAAR